MLTVRHGVPGFQFVASHQRPRLKFPSTYVELRVLQCSIDVPLGVVAIIEAVAGARRTETRNGVPRPSREYLAVSRKRSRRVSGRKVQAGFGEIGSGILAARARPVCYDPRDRIGGVIERVSGGQRFGPAQ